MGLFSGKKKRYVDTQVTRMIDDESLPTPLKTALFEAIVGKNGDIGVSLKNAALNGPGRNFERMYRYGERGEYIHGLPDARLLSTQDGVEVARQVIENQLVQDPDERDSLEIEYAHFRPANNHHLAWNYLHENLNYNPDTNEIESLTPIFEDKAEKEGRYLTRIVAVHKASEEEREQLDPQALGVWGRGEATNISFAPATVSADGFDTISDVPQEGTTNPYSYEYRIVSPDDPSEVEAAEIHYAWEEKNITYNENGTVQSIERTLKEDSIKVDLSDYDPNAEFYQAKYSYMYEPTRLEYLRGDRPRRVYKYWTYDPETGDYPELDDVFASVDPLERTPGTYFPFAIFRSQQENKTEDDGSEEFKSTKKLLDYINIDFEDLGEAMHSEDNDGIDDLRQAVMVMAVPLDSDHQIELEYLFEYFTNVYRQVIEKDPKADQVSTEELLGRTGGARESSYALEISDSDFSMVISFDKIKKRYVTSDTDIGPVGHFTNEGTDISAEELGKLPFGVGDKIYTKIPKRRILRKQVIAGSEGGPGVIEEITIDNPTFKFPVKELRKKTLTVEGGVDDERLLIPLDRELCRNISTFKREVLYFRSMHFVLNSYVEQKVKWWQTGIFKVILLVVAVAVAWFTGPWSTALAIGIATANVTFVIFTLLSFLIEFFLVSMALEYAFKFAVDLVGQDVAFWLAVVAVAIGSGKAFGELAQGAKTISDSAMMYLKAASGLQSGISSSIASDMQSLHAERIAFEEEAKEKNEELAELHKEFISPVDIDPLYFVRRSEPFTMFGEPVTAYYERTVHSGNVGVLALDVISNYVDYSLTLPNTPERGT